jgi:hypothetical protein
MPNSWDADKEKRFQELSRLAAKVASTEYIDPKKNEAENRSRLATHTPIDTEADQIEKAAHAHSVAESDKPLEHPTIDPIDFAVPALGSLASASAREAASGLGSLIKRAGTAGVDAAAATARFPGQLVDKGTDIVLGGATGLKTPQVQAYMQSPKLVRLLKGAPESVQQPIAEKALLDTQAKLTTRAHSINNALRESGNGVTIPETSLVDAGSYAPQKSQAYIDSALKDAGYGDSYLGTPLDSLPAHAKASIPNEYQVPFNETVDSMRAAAKNRWQYDLEGKRYMENPDAMQAWKTMRTEASKANPALDPAMSELEQGIEAQKAIESGLNNPISAMHRGNDYAAARQNAGKLIGDGGLEKTASAFQAAKKLSTPTDSLTKAAIKPLGEAGLAIKAAAQPITNLPGRAIDGTARLAKSAINAVPDTGAGVLGQAATTSGIDDDALARLLKGKSSSQWSDDKERRLQELEALAGQQ